MNKTFNAIMILHTYFSTIFIPRMHFFLSSFDFSFLFLLILVHLFKNFAEEKKNG